MGCGGRGEPQLAVGTLLLPKGAKGDVLGTFRARAGPCAPHRGLSAQIPGPRARHSPGAEGWKVPSLSPGARPGSLAPSAEGLSTWKAHRVPKGAPPGLTGSAAGHSFRGTGLAGRGRTCAPAVAVAVAVARAAAGPWGGGGCSPGGGAPPARSKFSIRKLLPRLPKPGAAGKLKSAEEATTSQYAPACAARALGSMVAPAGRPHARL